MKTWQCTNCETANKIADEYCEVCGEKKILTVKKEIVKEKSIKLELKSSTAAFVSKYCNKCGKPYNKPTSKFCSYCGKKRN
jgi:rRNA maturation endonuclease Nob1